MATWAATAGDDAGLAAFHDWSERSASYDRTATDARWQHYRISPPTQIGAGSLFHEAKSNAATRLQTLEGFALDEDGIALAFTARHPDLKYDHDVKSWFIYTDVRWGAVKNGLADHFAREMGRDFKAIGNKRDSRWLASRKTARGVEAFAQADPVHAVTSEVWDKSKTLCGTPTGTLDLEKGILRRSQAKDMITKLTAVAPEGLFRADMCKIWLGFLREATGGDEGVIRFLQQWCGYCLTGITNEHALLFVYGPGGSGKSTFLNTLTGILGDYAVTAAMETFTESKYDRHSQEFARLQGARVVRVSETEEGRAWAATRVKNLVAGDKITARFMRENDRTFTPEFKLTIVGNHKPVLHSVDDAMRRRMNIVPFTRKPVRPDPDLEAKLRDEWPQILAWMVAGCLDWQKNRLVRPQVVLDAKADYFDSQDTFGDWLTECCQSGEASRHPLVT